MTKSCFRPDLMQGKTVFIAGGTSGINLGVAHALAMAGANLVVAGRNAEKAEAAAQSLCTQGVKALGLSLDVRNYEAVEAALKQTSHHFGEIDVVISGAAGNFLASALSMSSNAFRTVIDIDLIGTFNVFRASYAYIRKPGASLIAISAGQAVVPMTFQAHVCAAKAGVNMLTKVLGMEWGPSGVRVNAISPGPIAETEGMARLASTPEAETAWKDRIALRDFGTKRDIAEMVLFLASEASSYVTGSIFDCDGGWTLGDSSEHALTVPR
jgi:NAD(P)-dependent dehydrogenase (short-subunit alcohol dehydrogenase family)